MLRNRLLKLCCLLSFALVAFAVPVSAEKPAPVTHTVQNVDSPDAIDGEYIIILNAPALRSAGSSDVSQSSQTFAKAVLSDSDDQLLYTYDSAVKGFSARLSDETLAELQSDPLVASIEVNQYATTSTEWGLDRSDQRDLPLNNVYDTELTGRGVHAYILDTGVRATHSEFTGRMGNGYDAITLGGSANDCDGHGTHVAGTVGGTTYGMAPDATIHPIRVLDCDGFGSYAGIIAGIDWVKNNHIKPAVGNLSLGGGYSSALNQAMSNAIQAGVVMVVAAGNDSAVACNYSPASAPDAITVGSTTFRDARSSFSNHGSCLDIFAPGSSIRSASYLGDTQSSVLSGTSMASPHVAGAVALYLEANPTASTQEVADALIDSSTKNKIADVRIGSPNRLLYIGDWTSNGNPLPTATPSAPVPTSTPAPVPTATQPPATGSCTADVWSATATYYGGNVVSHAGHEWEAKWWTNNNDPSTSNGSGLPWKDLGACSGGGNPTPIPPTEIPATEIPATEIPATEVPSTPVPPTATPPVSGICSSPAWSASKTYYGGEVVSHNGNEWEAKWWTKNQDPSTNNSSALPWKDLGACSTTASQEIVAFANISSNNVPDANPTQVSLSEVDSTQMVTPLLLLSVVTLGGVTVAVRRHRAIK